MMTIENVPIMCHAAEIALKIPASVLRGAHQTRGGVGRHGMG
jgi:hypothetical protein